MMQLVAGDDVSNSAHADLVLIRGSAAHPCRLIEIAQQRQRGAAYGDEFFDKISERTMRERTIRT